ncbi:MAG: radical SAM protein [Synergistaceae bacterium]|nr:radical SAM protein [Synergistaceae bacterium]
MWVKCKKVIKKVFPFLVPAAKSVVNFIKYDVILPIKIFLHIPEKKPHKLINFEVHLADHCNLNCVGCNHFSPLAEPSCVSIETFKRDFERMGELFSHKCGRIHLLGGEPLLNPDVIELMKIARENFPEGEINIYTNGILLPQQDEKFWRACHDNNINIIMTHYPIKIDVDKINSLADKFNVVFHCSMADKTMFKNPLDLSGSGNAIKNFAKCAKGNGCIFLDDGKLYTCTLISNLKFFNKAFNQNIPVTEADYINIYDDITSDEIFKRLATHVPVCSYCNMDDFEGDIEWHVSKREMSEWV